MPAICARNIGARAGTGGLPPSVSLEMRQLSEQRAGAYEASGALEKGRGRAGAWQRALSGGAWSGERWGWGGPISLTNANSDSAVVGGRRSLQTVPEGPKKEPQKPTISIRPSAHGPIFPTMSLAPPKPRTLCQRPGGVPVSKRVCAQAL